MNKVLGKGLSALIPEKESLLKTERDILFVKTATIKDSTMQPRIDYDIDKLEELKKSIEKRGILQPILVREKKEGIYEVIAGERRLKAARELSLEEIPVIVKNVTDQDALVIALVENIQREELNPIEEAESFKKLIEDFGYSQEDVAYAVGKNRSTVSNFLRLLKLPDFIQKGLSQRKISTGHARALLGVNDIKKQKEIFDLIAEKDLSVREVELLVRKTTESFSSKKKKMERKDPNILALEDLLQKHLGTKVSIFSKEKRGKILIEYYSLDDLDRIIKTIRK